MAQRIMYKGNTVLLLISYVRYWYYYWDGLSSYSHSQTQVFTNIRDIERRLVVFNKCFRWRKREGLECPRENIRNLLLLEEARHHKLRAEQKKTSLSSSLTKLHELQLSKSQPSLTRTSCERERMTSWSRWGEFCDVCCSNGPSRWKG